VCLEPVVDPPHERRLPGHHAYLLHEADPLADYAFLLAHDAQRLLFPRFKINPGHSNLVSDVTPRIADPYRMLQSTCLFPPLARALDIGQKLALTPGALQLAGGPVSFNPGPQLQSLVDVSSWKGQLDYRNVKFTIDSLKSWQVQIDRLEQKLSFDIGGDIFSIVHDAVSVAGLPTKFGTPDVRFPPALAAVTSVLDMLEQVLPAAVRGGDGP